MKRIIIALTMIFLFGGLTIPSIDIGVPTINAICKLELKNGDIKEGIMCILPGGYDGYRKNGFVSRLGNSEYKNYYLFSISNYKLDLHAPEYNKEKKTIDYPQFFYALAQYQGDPERNQSTTFNDTSLISKITNTYRYKLLKHLYLFEELKGSLYVPWNNLHTSLEFTKNMKCSRINVDDISTFELVVYPGEKWINEIRKTRGAYYSRGEECEDCQEPLWYHEIRKDIELYNRLIGELGEKGQTY